MEKICARLGVGLIERKVGGDRPVIEIAGVDVAAIEAASSRRDGIKPALDQLVADYTDDHGYAPNTKAMIALAQQATLDTRPAKKQARQLSVLVGEWTEELGSHSRRRDRPGSRPRRPGHTATTPARKPTRTTPCGWSRTPTRSTRHRKPRASSTPWNGPAASGENTTSTPKPAAGSAPASANSPSRRC
jgi:hypothetical protein